MAAINGRVLLLKVDLFGSVRTDRPAVDGDWSVLSELFLRFMHLADEIDESLAGFGHSLFRPISELELTHCPRLTVLHVKPRNHTQENSPLPLPSLPRSATHHRRVLVSRICMESTLRAWWDENMTSSTKPEVYKISERHQSSSSSSCCCCCCCFITSLRLKV